MLSISGEDGPSQMALEDLAMFRTVPGATVFYPSDAVSTERAVELAANTKGLCFIRSSRPNVPILYQNNEVFKVGQAKVRCCFVLHRPCGRSGDLGASVESTCSCS